MTSFMDGPLSLVPPLPLDEVSSLQTQVLALFHPVSLRYFFYILQRAISSREPASHFVRLHNSIRGIVTFFHGDDKHKIEADERLMRVARYDGDRARSNKPTNR